MIKENKITEGIIWKEVIFLFIPIVISAFFQHFYTFVDGMIVGQYLGAKCDKWLWNGRSCCVVGVC
ncbi:MAG: hypothetical protein R3Y09_13335 [Clostridia bacterium]